MSDSERSCVGRVMKILKLCEHLSPITINNTKEQIIHINPALIYNK